MKISVKYLVMVRVDKRCTIFMAGNVSVTSNTKHLDIRYKYGNDYVKDVIVKKFLLSLLKMTVTFLQQFKVKTYMKSIHRFFSEKPK